jgi:hypothetical protein
MLQVLLVSVLGSRMLTGGSALLRRRGRLIERCCGPIKLGVFPGRHSPEEVFSPSAAGSMRGPQSSLAARKFAGSRFLWCFVSYSGGVFGGGSWRRTMAFQCRGLQGLVCNLFFLGVLSAKCRDNWCFWSILAGSACVVSWLFDE